jgi:hypothetical protein
MTRGVWFKSLMLALFACALVARAAWSGAYSSGYEPLPNAKQFPLRDCLRERSTDIRELHVCRSKGSVSSIDLHISETLRQVEISRNGSLKARVRLSEYPIWAGFDYVLEGDLNRDGLSDYVLVEPSGGNGLASEYCHAIFVLSSKSGYVVTKLNTMGFDPKDLLQLGAGQTNVLHTWFIGAEEPSRDGKYHSYWVYHFLKVRGTKLVFDSSRRPIWIQYKFKHNHTPTRLLSSDQKKRLWDKQREPIFVR